MRINKYLGECGVCSRREADLLIEDGLVEVNGRPAQSGMQIEEGDEVFVRGKKIEPLTEYTYIAFYKPVGLVCTFGDQSENNLKKYLKDHMPGQKRLTYAGRLDKDSEGLLLLTDDGDLNDALMTARNGHEKEYVVKVAHSLTREKTERLAQGIYIHDLKRKTRPCKVWESGENEMHMILTQGWKRQIRLMCREVGLRVVSLKRIRIEHILLGDLKAGEYRKLSPEEVAQLERLKRKTGKSNLRS